MKQGLNYHLPVEFVGLDLADVEKIEFIFKDAIYNRKVKEEMYSSDGAGNAKKQEGSANIVLVPFSVAETYDFLGRFLMDTRITLKGSTDQPITEVIDLNMDRTLFDKE